MTDTAHARAQIDAIIAEIARIQAAGPLPVGESKQAEDIEAIEIVRGIERRAKASRRETAA
jgi:hypothetical protein